MNRAIRYLLVFLLISFSCKTEKSKENLEKPTIKSEERKVDIADVSIKSVTYKELKPLLQKTTDSIYVVNFWATWCKPCVAELPYFEKLNKEYAQIGRAHV